MTILIIIVAILLAVLLITNSGSNKEVDRRASNNNNNNTQLYNNEITIKTTQMTYPHSDDVIDMNFTFKANYKDTDDLARIYNEDDIDLYKRIPNTPSRFGVNSRGKKMREDSFIMDGDRFDVTFIEDSDVKISILTLEYNLVTYYK